MQEGGRVVFRLIEAVLPNIARRTHGGWIKIGDQDWRGFAASAPDERRIICEGDEQ